MGKLSDEELEELHQVRKRYRASSDLLQGHTLSREDAEAEGLRNMSLWTRLRELERGAGIGVKKEIFPVVEAHPELYGDAARKRLDEIRNLEGYLGPSQRKDGSFVTMGEKERQELSAESLALMASLQDSE